MNNYLTIDEVAVALNRSRRQVERYIERGALPRMVNTANLRKVYIPAEAVEQFGGSFVPLPERKRPRSNTEAMYPLAGKSPEELMRMEAATRRRPTPSPKAD